MRRDNAIPYGGRRENSRRGRGLSPNPKKLTIGYFRQDVEEMQGRSVLDETIAGSGRVGDLRNELEALRRKMSDPDKADDMDRILERCGHVHEEYEHLGGYSLESQAREVLHGLGFKDNQIDGDAGAFLKADGRCALRWHGGPIQALSSPELSQ